MGNAAVCIRRADTQVCPYIRHSPSASASAIEARVIRHTPVAPAMAFAVRYAGRPPVYCMAGPFGPLSHSLGEGWGEGKRIALTNALRSANTSLHSLSVESCQTNEKNFAETSKSCSVRAQEAGRYQAEQDPQRSGSCSNLAQDEAPQAGREVAYTLVIPAKAGIQEALVASRRMPVQK